MIPYVLLQVKVEKDEKSYFVMLSLVNVTVEDAGKYKVTAKNELGESNATISLNFDSEYPQAGRQRLSLPPTPSAKGYIFLSFL